MKSDLTKAAFADSGSGSNRSRREDLGSTRGSSDRGANKGHFKNCVLNFCSSKVLKVNVFRIIADWSCQEFVTIHDGYPKALLAAVINTFSLVVIRICYLPASDFVRAGGSTSSCFTSCTCGNSGKVDA